MSAIIKPEIRYEDSAEQATVTGWVCKKCKHFWGNDEHMARYCCCTTRPCKCGKRTEKHYTVCEECRRMAAKEEWYAKPEVEWDGKFPVALWDHDQYFFDEAELIEYLDEYDFGGSEKLSHHQLLGELWLTTTSPNNGCDFVMSEFLQDALGEDQDIDEKEINKTVNDWIDKNSPFSWSATGKRLSTDSVAKLLQVDIPTVG